MRMSTDTMPPLMPEKSANIVTNVPPLHVRSLCWNRDDTTSPLPQNSTVLCMLKDAVLPSPPQASLAADEQARRRHTPASADQQRARGHNSAQPLPGKVWHISTNPLGGLDAEEAPLTWPREHPRAGCRQRHHVVGLRPGPATAMQTLTSRSDHIAAFMQYGFCVHAT